MIIGCVSAIYHQHNKFHDVCSKRLASNFQMSQMVYQTVSQNHVQRFVIRGIFIGQNNIKSYPVELAKMRPTNNILGLYLPSAGLVVKDACLKPWPWKFEPCWSLHSFMSVWCLEYSYSKGKYVTLPIQHILASIIQLEISMEHFEMGDECPL